MQKAVVRRLELPALLGLSVATIDRLRAKGEFVPEIQLGMQAIGFSLSDIEAWIASRRKH